MAESNEKNDDKKGLTERLLDTRTIFISGEISQKLARDVGTQLLVLAADSDKPIDLFINSQGGHVESGDTIFDMIRFVSPRVRIIGTGWVASAGALIYMSVPKQDRFSLPHTRYMLHQPSGGVGGQETDISIEAEEIVKMKHRLNRTISEQTGQPIESVIKKTERNFWMSAEEAKDYGLVGTVITSAEALQKA